MNRDKAVWTFFVAFYGGMAALLVWIFKKTHEVGVEANLDRLAECDLLITQAHKSGLISGAEKSTLSQRARQGAPITAIRREVSLYSRRRYR